MPLKTKKKQYLQAIHPRSYYDSNHPEQKTLNNYFSSFLNTYIKNFKEMIKYNLFAPYDGAWDTEKEYLKILMTRIGFDLGSIFIMTSISVMLPFIYLFSNANDRPSLLDAIKYACIIYLVGLPLTLGIGLLDLNIQIASYLISPFTRALSTLGHLIQDKLSITDLEENNFTPSIRN